MYNGDEFGRPTQWAKAHFFIDRGRFGRGFSEMRNAQIIEKVEEIVTRAGREGGIEPVEVQLVGSGSQRVLRIFIDKPAGVTHSDCEMISDYVGTVLDVEDVIPGGRYTLEVSSPGLERPLKRPKDYERYIGRRVKVVLREPLEGSKVFEGELSSFAGGMVELRRAAGGPVSFPFEQVARAHLKFEW
jgi:ribosome maturation factor RimP